MEKKTRQEMETELMDGFRGAELEDRETGFQAAIELMSFEQLKKLHEILGA